MLKYYPRKKGSRHGLIGWGGQHKDYAECREHAIIWSWEPNEILFGIDWYRSGDYKFKSNRYLAITIHLPFYRIWYKYEQYRK